MVAAAITVGALFAGRARVLVPGKEPSAIAKTRLHGAVRLGPTGIAGDEQGDPTVHGGPEKALHHYPAQHYPLWQAELGENPCFRPGGFGETLSAAGLDEDNTCVGDVFRIGGALVQVSQGRQPCWKLSAHTGIERMAYRMQRSLRTGWYCRVLEPGEIAAGDAITRVERPHPGFTVRRVSGARMGRPTPEEAATLAELTFLAPGWRAALARKADPGHVEDESARLDG